MRSPIRMPGGKQKALKQILPLIPDCQEFREPFVGGGSVSLMIADRDPQPEIWINDLNRDLTHFWKMLRDQSSELIARIERIKQIGESGRELYSGWKAFEPSTAMEAAIRFFILNRITYSGLLDSGGYSQQAFEKRFTQSSIDRLLDLDLFGFKITCGDYEPVMLAPGNDVFLFLDPPYLKAEKSKLYGKNGSLHKGFNHERFAEVCKQCPHKFLITYDDSPEIRKLFGWGNVREWSLQYSMNNAGGNKPAKGSELFITNF